MADTVNRPQAASSSDSSDEEQADLTSSQANTDERKKEEHKSKDCHYEPRSGERVVKDGDKEKTITFYMFVRVCKCGNLTDRSKLLEESELDFEEMDGKQIHFSSECKWEKPSEISRKGQTIFILRAYCNGCKQPQTNNTGTPMNKPE